MAMTELKGRPVPFTPTFRRASSAPIAWQRSAKTKGAIYSGDAETKHTAPRAGERRDIVCHLTIVIFLIASIRLVEQLTDELGVGKCAGGGPWWV
jgi:hypothetical protein